MSMIERYRKKGGFFQLLNLIETTGKDKQEKFLKMIAEESPAWESEVRKRLLTIDKILSWNPTYLAEIFPRIQPLQLAMVVGGLPPEKAEQFMKILNFKEKRQVEEVLKEKTPSPGETSAGVMKLFSEIRKMEAEGSLKFEKFDPDMVVPEDIEDRLGKGVSFATIPTGTTEVAVGNMPPPPAGIPSNVAEELTNLRRKLVQLTQENHKLHHDNQTMKDKLDQIKKIA
ncbi:MAG: FliG C-terminal domain-containing protein [Pseudobdellovibrionaceae bacterium]